MAHERRHRGLAAVPRLRVMPERQRPHSGARRASRGVHLDAAKLRRNPTVPRGVRPHI